jgi:hypothetical protein
MVRSRYTLGLDCWRGAMAGVGENYKGDRDLRHVKLEAVMAPIYRESEVQISALENRIKANQMLVVTDNCTTLTRAARL